MPQREVRFAFRRAGMIQKRNLLRFKHGRSPISSESPGFIAAEIWNAPCISAAKDQEDTHASTRAYWKMGSSRKHDHAL